MDPVDPQDSTGAGIVTLQPWQTLRRYTDARIALGRAGHSLPTAAHLQFQLDHAEARDAVHLPLDTESLARQVAALGRKPVLLHSRAPDRRTYLQRPDLGRRLDAASVQTLVAQQSPAASSHDSRRDDVAFVVVDGLSARAIHQNAAPLLGSMLARLRDDVETPWSIAPIAIVTLGRVAVGDEAGELLQARTVVVLIGERPGLSSPDSMGLYVSWAPRIGLVDALRNCISNIRPAGLAVDEAAARLHYLLRESRRRRLTGVDLKEDTPSGSTLA